MENIPITLCVSCWILCLFWGTAFSKVKTGKFGKIKTRLTVTLSFFLLEWKRQDNSSNTKSVPCKERNSLANVRVKKDMKVIQNVTKIPGENVIYQSFIFPDFHVFWNSRKFYEKALRSSLVLLKFQVCDRGLTCDYSGTELYKECILAKFPKFQISKIS